MNNSINNMTKILRVVLDNSPLRLKDISNQTGLSASNVYKILKGMEQNDYVIRDPVDKKYICGSLIQKIAHKINETDDVLTICAYDELVKLRNHCEETVGLFIRIGTRRAAIMEMIFGNQFYVTMNHLQVPIYTGASGLVLLSQLPDNKVSKILDSTEYVRVGPNTITEREALFRELELVRKQGYAVSTGTVTKNQLITGLAVPVSNYPVPLALAIYGHRENFDPKIQNCIQTIKECAENISNKLLAWKS